MAEDGTVRCWGSGEFGVLGYGNTFDIGDDEPAGSAGIVDIGGRAVQVRAGSTKTCALLDNGDVRCWGAMMRGNVVRARYNHGFEPDIGDNEPPSVDDNPIVRLPKVRQMVLGSGKGCAICDEGAVHCWGSDMLSPYGHPMGRDKKGFGWEIDFGGKAAQLTAGDFYVCALLDSGAVRCWGTNRVGQLGYGNTATVGDDETPAEVGDVNIGGKAVSLTAGALHTCAILVGGKVRCWGGNGLGQLGYGHTYRVGDDEVPAVAGDVDLDGVAVALAAGSAHTCALLSTGHVRCWGWGLLLGTGTRQTVGDDESPREGKDVDLGGLAEQITAGGDHTCAVMRSTGAVRCWGFNDSGELGYGHTRTIGDDESPASAGDVPLFGVE